MQIQKNAKAGVYPKGKPLGFTPKGIFDKRKDARSQNVLPTQFGDLAGHCQVPKKSQPSIEGSSLVGVSLNPDGP